MDSRNYYNFDGLVLDLNTQKIYGLKNGKNYPLIGKSQLSYTRERENKGPKTLHSSISATADTYISSNHQLFTYDHLIAIDTNTHYLNGSSVSITAAYHIKPEARQADLVRCSARVLALLELWNVVEKPENVGWWQVLQALQQHPTLFEGNIGLIVDSDLGNHKAFNAREKAIFNDFYLPDNVTLIYASDKGGAEYLSTKMIKYCHDLASDLYIPHKLVMNIKDFYSGQEGVYSHIRQWDTGASNIRPF